MKTASDPLPENSPFPEPIPTETASLPEPDPAAPAPPSLLDGTTFRFAHSPAAPPEIQNPSETQSPEPNAFVSFAASEEERLLTAARAVRRRRAHLVETLFRWGMALLMLSSGAVAVWRLVWMGQ